MSDRPFLPPSRDEIQRRSARDFAHGLKHLALHRGQFGAIQGAIESRASATVVEVVRAAVGADALGDGSGALADNTAAVAWVGSLSAAGAFDRMLGDGAFRPGRMMSKFAVVSQTVVAERVDEGRGKPVRSLVLSSIGNLLPKKVATIFITSDELLRYSSDATGLFNGELQSGLAVGSDVLFFTELAAATAPIPSGGDTLGDVGLLLQAVTLTAASRPYFVFSPGVMKEMVVETTTGGIRVWPELRLDGTGAIAAVPALISDGLPAGSAFLVDAASIAAANGGVAIDTSIQAALQLDDAPTQDSVTPTATQVISLFQMNSVGIRAERTLAFQLLRPTGVASIDGFGGAP